MKTKPETIEETVQYYSEDTSRRAVNERGGCRYYDSDTGNMCAVGRCLIDAKGAQEKHPFKGIEYIILKYLKPECKGHGWGFWNNLQKLHDEHSYWNEEGLTEEGQDYVNELKQMT